MEKTIEEIYKSGLKKLWVFKRIKEFGLPVKDLVDLPWNTVCTDSHIVEEMVNT